MVWCLLFGGEGFVGAFIEIVFLLMVFLMCAGILGVLQVLLLLRATKQFTRQSSLMSELIPLNFETIQLCIQCRVQVLVGSIVLCSVHTYIVRYQNCPTTGY